MKVDSTCIPFETSWQNDDFVLGAVASGECEHEDLGCTGALLSKSMMNPLTGSKPRNFQKMNLKT